MACSSAGQRYSRGSGRSLARDEHLRALAQRRQQAVHRRSASRARLRPGARGWPRRSWRRADALEHEPPGAVDRFLALMPSDPSRFARRSSAAVDLGLDHGVQAHRPVSGVVVGEVERRRALERQLARDATLQVAVRAAQTCQRVRLSPRPRRSTLTYTRAWLRSALVLTSVTVTNPTLGSFKSEASASPITCLIASSTRRIRSELILPVHVSRKTRLAPLLA